MSTKAVLFDVDFTLIEPGPMFQAGGYQAFCARHGMHVDASRFDEAVVDAASVLDAAGDTPYDAEIFVAYTRHIIEQMGGTGESLDACAREIYGDAAWYVPLESDVRSATAAIRTLLEDPASREPMLTRAPEILARYSWDTAAEQTLAGIEGIVRR